MSRRDDIIDEDIDTILASPLPWERFSDMTVAITGAAGFVPAYMVETLLSLGNRLNSPPRVIALVRDVEKARTRFARHLSSDSLEIVRHDASDAIAVERAANFIVHAASLASPKHYGVDPVGVARPNTVGTDHLLQWATDLGARLLYFSSSEVYGEAPVAPTGEMDFGVIDHPTSARACYAESKRAGEMLCASYARQFGTEAVVVRPFHTYGPGMALDDGRVFADFVSDVVAGRNIGLTSDGMATRSFCYLGDATEAFFRVLLIGATGEAYNVGNPDTEISIRDLADLIAEMHPELRVEVVRQPNRIDGYTSSTVLRSCPAIDKIVALGWRPSTGLASGLKYTIESFR